MKKMDSYSTRCLVQLPGYMVVSLGEGELNNADRRQRRKLYQVSPLFIIRILYNGLRGALYDFSERFDKIAMLFILFTM